MRPLYKKIFSSIFMPFRFRNNLKFQIGTNKVHKGLELNLNRYYNNNSSHVLHPMDLQEKPLLSSDFDSLSNGKPHSSVQESMNVYEIKDSNLIFNQAMESLSQKYGPHNLTFPKEIIFLSGAPGAGKATVSKYIERKRGFTNKAIVCSDLLNTPEFQEFKKKGELIGDKKVVEVVFEHLIRPENASGVILDGFPRTRVQAECISLLYDKLLSWVTDYENTIHRLKFRRPIFTMIILYCDENVSIQRQLKRGKLASDRNKLLDMIGDSEHMMEERTTDSSEEYARKRYLHFKQSLFESLKVLRQKFPHCHFIDANGTIEQVLKNIDIELAYQSSAELSLECFEKISQIPPVEQLTANARYNLVKRLEAYAMYNGPLLDQVIQVIRQEFLHIVERQALTGSATIRTQNNIFEDPTALNMALDIFVERGFDVRLDVEKALVPIRVDPSTFEVITQKQKVFHFQLSFKKPDIRN